ncbi:hypothetical protein DM992_30245 [Burkholderia sp. JP2-270]|nr:hypothetical protein DM992_30245 [Burkholderia sp. JP2-270]
MRLLNDNELAIPSGAVFAGDVGNAVGAAVGGLVGGEVGGRSARRSVAPWVPLRGRPSVKQLVMLLAAIPAIARVTLVPATAAMAEETAAVINR